MLDIIRQIDWPVWLILLILSLWSGWIFIPETKQKKRRRRQLKPKAPTDCLWCRLDARRLKQPEPPQVTPWSSQKSRRGRPKQSTSQGFACPNQTCAYYGIKDSHIHALVSNGWRGKTERIRQWRCQGCGCRFSSRIGTPMYQLKTPSGRVKEVLTALAEGVDLSGCGRIFNHHPQTISRWLLRMGHHAQKLHAWYLVEVMTPFVQLDELATKVKKQGQRVWLWTAICTQSKLLLVMHLGHRRQQDAHWVIHQLKEKLLSGHKPIFTSDGLRHYFYSLTAHYGHWYRLEGSRRPRWQVDPHLLYGQVKKSYRRYRLKNLTKRTLLGSPKAMTSALQELGLTGQIQTAFVERLNLTLRQLAAPLSRRTWSLAYDKKHLRLHLEWVRAYYHFVRPHRSLSFFLPNGRLRYQTPAMAAGLTTSQWSVERILQIPFLS